MHKIDASLFASAHMGDTQAAGRAAALRLPDRVVHDAEKKRARLNIQAGTLGVEQKLLSLGGSRMPYVPRAGSLASQAAGPAGGAMRGQSRQAHSGRLKSRRRSDSEVRPLRCGL